jgi:hypothetical protein
MNVKRLAYVVRTVEEAFPNGAEAAAPAGKQAIVTAVERYLRQRGIEPEAPAAAPVASLVDRFLETKRSAPVPPPAVPPSAAAPPSNPAPRVEITDFVCEADVRAALHQSRKIYIGAKTIVTPAARELASQHDILVLAER